MITHWPHCCLAAGDSQLFDVLLKPNSIKLSVGGFVVLPSICVSEGKFPLTGIHAKLTAMGYSDMNCVPGNISFSTSQLFVASTLYFVWAAGSVLELSLGSSTCSIWIWFLFGTKYLDLMAKMLIFWSHHTIEPFSSCLQSLPNVSISALIL